jgi:hypothetical protein
LVCKGAVGVEFAGRRDDDVTWSEIELLATDLNKPSAGGDDHHLAASVDMWRGDTAGFHRDHSCVEAAIIMRALPPLRDNGLSLFGNGVGSPLYLVGSNDSHRQESRAAFGRPLWP